MYANYHTHTYRCGHASGTEEEYIERAVSCGIKIMGFSDHATFGFPDGHKTNWRVPVDLAEDYIATLRSLREKYKDKIELHIGFEMEYYPSLFADMLEYVKSLGAEYLILGEHFFEDETAYSVHSAKAGHDEADLTAYTDMVIAGMKTGKFSYVAHPDMLNFSGDSTVYDREAKRLCRAARELDIPLEINFLGIYDNRHYPNERFWKTAGETGVKVIFGFDAHDAQRAYDGESLKKAQALVQKYGLNLIDETELKKL